MKKHYYFAQGVITYKKGDIEIEYKKQVSYELTQEQDCSDRIFFLGVEGELRRQLKKSFLQSLPGLEEDTIISTSISAISRLN